jgi:hypothetical protein
MRTASNFLTNRIEDHARTVGAGYLLYSHWSQTFCLRQGLERVRSPGQEELAMRIGEFSAQTDVARVLSELLVWSPMLGWIYPA